MNANFLISVGSAKAFPKIELPEVVFTGRSNVGKSTLINKILNKKNLVKTGKTPGKTKLFNFFNINEKLIFVDMPGFGYAKVAKTEKILWTELISAYFSNRPSLKLCFILIDIRRKIEEGEKQLIEMLKFYQIPYCFILTKADKFTKNQLFSQIARHAKEIQINKEELIIFSAEQRIGIKDVHDKITEITKVQWL